jgi:mannonate dehydratase
MKLGLGLYPSLLTDDNFRFARQLGVTHITVHLPGAETFPSTPSGVWSLEDMERLKGHINSFGLEMYAIENFQPRHWDQILLGGPGRDAQMENLKTTIRNLGRAGIPCMGYCFTLAGVWGRVPGPFARGGAESVGYLRDQAPEEIPIPLGEVWGTRVDDNPPPGNIGTVTHEQMWERLTYFLENLVPVAEEADVRLAAHPDDPPLPVLRGTARLITHPDHYKRLIEIVPSPSNGLEFCQGTVAEMAEGDVYEAIRYFTERRKICYVHFRNVRGKVPHYQEVFIDEGDVDMIRAMQVYHAAGFDGVFIPDHTPAVSCAAPWHAGMAFALGYMRAILKHLGAG